MSNYIQLANNLDQLKLTKIKEYLPTYLDDAIVKNLSFVDILLDLTNKEIDFRKKRAAEINLAVSNFPFIKKINDFDFSYQPSISKKQILDFTSLRFIESFENILFIGLSVHLELVKPILLLQLELKLLAIIFQLTLFIFKH